MGAGPPTSNRARLGHDGEAGSYPRRPKGHLTESPLPLQAGAVLTLWVSLQSTWTFLLAAWSFCLLFVFKAAPAADGSSQGSGPNRSCTHRPQPQQCQIQAMSSTYLRSNWWQRGLLSKAGDGLHLLMDTSWVLNLLNLNRTSGMHLLNTANTFKKQTWSSRRGAVVNESD